MDSAALIRTMNNLLTWQVGAGVVIVYFLCFVLYRLKFSPLSHFPGPKITAITRYYEGYHDVVKGGQYTFKIRQMHQKYGPIVRISPYELHVNDPAFYDTLYRQDTRYDKHAWTVDAFGVYEATLFTVAHDIHKSRRQPLNSFFSKARVATQQHTIRRHLDKLVSRLSRYADTGTEFDVGAATTAFARDAANDFILAKSYNSLDREDFDAAMLAASSGAGGMWRLTKFVRFVAPVMFKIPIPLTAKVATGNTKIFFQYLQESLQDTASLMAAATSPTPDEKGPRTIVHDIMESKLPPSAKRFDRMFEEVSTITGAGFETTASVLRLIFFHLFTDPPLLHRLRTELSAAGAHPDHPLDLKVLEQLPVLTAILTEGLRLSPGVASRLARVAPNTDLVYDQWRIPAGTPVGMTTILLHMNETQYPEPQRFNPDRWIGDGAQDKADRLFVPFSKGPRICLGMYFAWAEMYIAVAELVQRFDMQFINATADDFECVSDQFAIGTRCKGFVRATVSHCHE